MGGVGGFTCIPEEVAVEVHSLQRELDLFLQNDTEDEMGGIALEMRVTRLVINGHIPLPCTLTAAEAFLRNHDTSSLPQAVLMSPAMGETVGTTERG